MHGREALINHQEVDSVEIKGSVYSLDWTTGLARIKLLPNIFTVDPDIRIQYPIILLVWSCHMEYDDHDHDLPMARKEHL